MSGVEVVDDEIRRALAQLEAAHDVVGDDLQHEPVVSRPAVEVAVERRQLDAIVDRVANEPVRSGADRVIARTRRPAPSGTMRHDEVDRKRSERLLQREHDGVAVARVDRLRARGSRPCAARRSRIEEAPERVDDVGRRQLVAVVEADAASQRDDVGGRDRGCRGARPARARRAGGRRASSGRRRSAGRSSATHRRCRCADRGCSGRSGSPTTRTFGIRRRTLKAADGATQQRAGPRKRQLAGRHPCALFLQLRQQRQRFERRHAIDVDRREPLAQPIVGAAAPGTARAAAADRSACR